MTNQAKTPTQKAVSQEFLLKTFEKHSGVFKKIYIIFLSFHLFHLRLIQLSQRAPRAGESFSYDPSILNLIAKHNRGDKKTKRKEKKRKRTCARTGFDKTGQWCTYLILVLRAMREFNYF